MLTVVRTRLLQQQPQRLFATAATATSQGGSGGGSGGGWNVRPVKPAAGAGGGTGGSEKGRTMGIAFFGGVTAYGAYLGL